MNDAGCNMRAGDLLASGTISGPVSPKMSYSKWADIARIEKVALFTFFKLKGLFALAVSSSSDSTFLVSEALVRFSLSYVFLMM